MHIKSKHIAIYGKVKILRGYCKNCKSMAFIIDNKLQCCDAIYVGDETDKQEIIVQPRYKRISLTSKQRREIIDGQDNKCYYCGREFNSAYYRDNRLLFTTIHIDHMIPFSFNQDNGNDNLVATCSLCNLTKHNKMFNNLEDIKKHVLDRQKKKKIIFYEDMQELSEDIQD